MARHDLDGSERQRMGLTVAPEVFHRLRRHAILTGVYANEHSSRAIERQVAEWVAQTVEMVTPLGDKATKAAGEGFPPRLGDVQRGFNRDLSRDVPTGDLARVTVRIDPLLLEDWIDAVWHQHDAYPYLSFAFEAALVAYLDEQGA